MSNKMSKAGQYYFKLKEQAEYYGQDLDFETLEFIPKVQHEKKPEWLQRHLDKPVDFDTLIDMDKDDER